MKKETHGLFSSFLYYRKKLGLKQSKQLGYIQIVN